MKKTKPIRLAALTAAVMAAGMLMPTYAVAALDSIEITPSAYLTDHAGDLTVNVQTERDIRVKIVKQTKEGSITYYNTLLEDAGTYHFWLDSCEYDMDSGEYLSTFSVTVLDEKDSGCAYTENDLLVYDPGFSTEVTGSAFTWSVSSVEAETRQANGTAIATMTGSVWTSSNDVTLQYIPYTLGDLDNSGKIDMTDAYRTLMYSSYIALGQEPSFTDGSSVLAENSAFAAADINKNLKIEMVDAYYILMYSSYSALGTPKDWSEIVK